MFNKTPLAVLGVAIFLMLPTANAAESYAPTDAEVRPLPAFCRAHFRPQWKAFDPELVSPPQPGGKHLQHYCHALKFVIRSRRGRGADDRKHNLTRARGEYGYVLRHESPDFWMRPQLYVELGRIEEDLGAVASAQKLFFDAIAFNGKYEAGYTELIESLRRTGGSEAALDVATQGLRHLPNSARLQKAYIELGGEMPFPDPIQIGATSTASSSAASSEEPSSTDSAESQGAESVPTSGCRFCPPDEIQQRWRESFQGED